MFSLQRLVKFISVHWNLCNVNVILNNVSMLIQNEYHSFSIVFRKFYLVSYCCKKYKRMFG